MFYNNQINMEAKEFIIKNTKPSGHDEYGKHGKQVLWDDNEVELMLNNYANQKVLAVLEGCFHKLNNSGRADTLIFNYCSVFMPFLPLLTTE